MKDLKPSDYLPVNPGDWSEDFDHENGNYICTCFECGYQFRGHKRRGVCKICMQPNWEEISKMQKPDKPFGPLPGCWSEGEMVGYAKCMIKKVRPKVIELEKANKRISDLYELCKQQHEALLAAPYSEQKRKALDAYNKLFEK